MIRFFLVLSFVFSSLVVFAQDTVSFDLDETLISSANMTRGDLRKAQSLGYKIYKTKSGEYSYVVRPGAEELLAYAKDLGFRVIIITANLESYAKDILNSSGLSKYIDAVYTAEDLEEDYNEDFDKYPYHRNRTYKPAKTFVKKTARTLKQYTVGLYNPVLKRSFLYITGSTNIRPYIPSLNSAKYPPIYGSRFHVDDTLRHVDQPLDYVGVHVPDFDGTKVSKYNSEPVWIQDIKEKLDYLKKYGWEDLFRREYHRDPLESVVEPI